MTAPFALDPRLAAASTWIADLPLCQARLQDDARYSWIVLAPRRAGCVELADLDASDRAQLLRELVVAGEAVRAVGEALGRPVERLNYGQLGLIVSQLHWHIVGRRHDDAAWPGPVWGHGVAELYEPQALAAAIESAAASIRVGVTQAARRPASRPKALRP